MEEDGSEDYNHNAGYIASDPGIGLITFVVFEHPHGYLFHKVADFGKTVCMSGTSYLQMKYNVIRPRGEVWTDRTKNGDITAREPCITPILILWASEEYLFRKGFHNSEDFSWDAIAGEIEYHSLNQIFSSAFHIISGNSSHD